VLLLHVRFKVVRQAIVEVPLIPILQESWIVYQAEPELELPIVGEEVLMLELESAARCLTK
jgi:hypothetical protein